MCYFFWQISKYQLIGNYSKRRFNSFSTANKKEQNGFHIKRHEVYFFFPPQNSSNNRLPLSIRMSQNQFSKVKQEIREISFPDLEKQISHKSTSRGS